MSNRNTQTSHASQEPTATANLQRDDNLGELFNRSKALVSNARGYIGQFANAVTVYTSFELGRYIVEEEQRGKERAAYGKRVLDSLSEYLTAEFGRGFSRRSVYRMRQFYLAYADRASQIVPTSLAQLPQLDAAGVISTLSRQSEETTIMPYPLAQSGGVIAEDFPFPLSWSHYQILMRIENHAERDFYEHEAIDGAWDVKTLKRQYGSSLYERLALSRDKKEVMRLAQEGATPQKPGDLIKSPFVLEFAGLADKAAYHESDLETAVVNHLRDFLLEMGKGFLFEARQKRFTFEWRDYYLDLVLYNRFLRCYVLVDFKADLLSHEDLGQMQMYVNYYDRHVKLPDENPTVGILLCKRSDQALVELTLPEDAHIYAPEYRLYLPDKELLQAKLAEWLAEERNDAE